MVVDKEHRILYVNNGFSSLTGYSRSNSLGRTPQLLASGRHGPEFYREMLGTIKEKGSWSGAICNRHQDGQLFSCWLEIGALAPGAPMGAAYVGVFSSLGDGGAEKELADLIAIVEGTSGD